MKNRDLETEAELVDRLTFTVDPIQLDRRNNSDNKLNLSSAITYCVCPACSQETAYKNVPYRLTQSAGSLEIGCNTRVFAQITDGEKVLATWLFSENTLDETITALMYIRERLK